MKKHLVNAVALLMLGLSSLALAQSFTGSISGRVLDPQQAVVANATVILKNTATGAERRASSNGDGDYTFVAVAPGKYTVRAEAIGFTAASAAVEVTVATALRADITLGVQGAQEVVTVAATGEGGVAVQTEQATLGTTVSGRQMLDLPSLTRNPYDFIATSAGAASDNAGRGAGFAINGQRASSGNFILDGGENNDTFVTGAAQIVPLDSVQEYRLQTNNYTAEYGRGAGFIANVVTKSGGNQYHGAAYWFNRNSALAANTFDNNANGQNRPVFNRNQFGGAFGGPIRKDRLFFFGSFEPILVRSSRPSNFFVPTPQLIAISSPATQALFQKFPIPSSISTTNVRTRTLCPFGKVCAGGANEVTIPAFAFVSVTAPRDAGAGDPQDTYLATGRVDYNFSEKTQLFGRYAFQDLNVFAESYSINPYSASLYQPRIQRNQNILLNLTRTWSGSLVTESRVVYNRLMGPVNPLRPQGGLPSFFFTSESARLPSGYSSFGGPQNIYQFMQTVSWTKGNHNLKFGGQYVHLRDNRTFGAYETADARFTNAQGLVNGVLRDYTIAINPKGKFPGETVAPPFGPPSFTRHFRYNEPAVFAQDTWKVTPRLTLTPGLRWEYFGVLHSPDKEKQLDANFYYGDGRNVFERIANGRFRRTVDAPDKYKNKFYLPDYKNFGPRLGLAYDLFGDGKTSFRTGIGVFYDRNFGNVVFNAIQNPPNYGTVRITAPALTAALLTNQYAIFPNAPITLRGTSARHLDQDLKTAYTVSWNASIEREVANKYVFGISYVGNSGNRLYSLNNINRLGSERFVRPACVAADDCGRLNINASSINTRGNLGHSSYHALQLKADSRYSEKLGLQFGANYTFSHSIDNNSSFFGDDPVANPIGFGFLDGFGPQLDKGPSDFDVTHRFVSNFIWDIPVGKNAKGWVGKYVLGGWQINGILQFQTGSPFSIFDSGIADFSVETARPRLVGPLPKLVGSRSRPDAASGNVFLYLPVSPAYNDDFECLPNATPFRCGPSVNGPFNGALPRNTFRRPGTQFHNVSFLKNWPVREGMKLQLRAELYNLFNHPNLYVIAGTNDIANFSFNQSATVTTSGVTASYLDSRQIVMALKLIF